MIAQISARQYWAWLKAANEKSTPPWEFDRERRERRLVIREIQHEMVDTLLLRREHDMTEYEYSFMVAIERVLEQEPLHVPILSPRQAVFLKKTFKRYFRHSDLLAEYEDPSLLADESDFFDPPAEHRAGRSMAKEIDQAGKTPRASTRKVPIAVESQRRRRR